MMDHRQDKKEKIDKIDKLSLSPQLPKITRLNRNTILLLSGIVLLVIILIFVSALSNSSSSDNSVPKSGVKPSVSAIKLNTKSVEALPSNYSDASQINQLLNRNQPPKIVMQIPPEIQSEISALRSSQSSLEGELAILKANQNKKPASPPQPQYSEQDKEAMASSVFVAGGSPLPIPKENADTEDKNKKDNANANQNKNGFYSEYDQQNNQAQKSSFLDSKPDKSIYNPNQIQYPASPYILQSGNTIPAILQTEIVSNLPGLITAVVRRDVYDSINGQYLLIPKGSRLIGEYNSTVSYGQTQLQAVFTRLVRPDGTSIVLPGKSSGVNDMGVSGFSGDVDNHWSGVIGAAALMTLFNLPAIWAQNEQNQGVGYAPYYANGSYAGGTYSMGSNAGTSALQSLGQAASQMGSTISQRQMNIQPTITIHAGYLFSIMVTKDIILPPYNPPMESIPEIAHG